MLGIPSQVTHLGEKTEVTTFVFWELIVECLQQFPHVRSSRLGAGDIIIAVGEADTDRLIDVQHIGIVVPAVFV